MKRLFILLLSVCAATAADAQDRLLLRSGDERLGRVVEITDSEVFFTRPDGGEAVRIPRAGLFSITYGSGERELFSETAPTADYPYPPVSRAYRPGDLFSEGGVRGLVIETSADGRHGLILSLDSHPNTTWSRTFDQDGRYGLEVTLGCVDSKDGWRNCLRLKQLVAEQALVPADLPAYAWCAAKGEGWYLPAEEELAGLWRLLGVDAQSLRTTGWRYARKRFKELLSACGGSTIIGTAFMMLWSSTEISAGEAHLCSFPEARAVRKKSDWAQVRALHRF